MKILFAALFLTLTWPNHGRAQEQIVTLGDSLTFDYQVEFGPGIAGLVGDGMGPDVLNWIEILSDPIYGDGRFDQGGEIDVTFAFFFDFFLRREYNWAIPGTRIDDLRRFLAGEVTVTQLLAESSNFDSFREALLLTTLSDIDYDLMELEAQLGSSAERVVLFIGGNDVNGIYREVYEDNMPGRFVADFMDDATWIVDWVLAKNPNIEFVLVNVPHIGITPLIKSKFPTDPVKTGQVTTVLEDLNNQLADLAESRGIAYADIYRATIPLLPDDPLCIHGIPFQNAGSVFGNLDFVWLNGEISDNFHPNTNAQALIGNEIIHSFNRHYSSGLSPLSATEILGDLLDKSAEEIDMPFADWASCYGFPGALVSEDGDRDGLSMGLEFALGLDPTRDDRDFVQSGLVNVGGASYFELAYPSRLTSSSRYTLTPMSSTDLQFAPLSPLPTLDSDGLYRAQLPLSQGTGFLQLEATIVP